MTTALVVAVGLFSLFGLAALVLYGKDHVASALQHRRNPPAKMAAEREVNLRRIKSPDWVFYTEHLQRAAPDSLVAWFGDATAVSKYYYFGDYYVAFSPIDRIAYEKEWVSPGVVAFAESDGDPLFLQPGINSTDAVFIAFHDGGGVEQIAPSVQAFLGGLRDAT